jgi:hypothetical protein
MKLKMKAQKKIILFSSALVLVALVAVGSTMAYLQSSTPKATNNFVVPVADIQINENSSSFQFDQNLTTIKQVRIQNVKHDNQSIPVYIRVKLVPIWRHAGTGEGTGIPVTGLTYGYGVSGTSSVPITPWVYHQADGYYYYKTPVAPENFTDYLIGKVTVAQPANQPGCDLEVQVIADSIQADGKMANGDSAAKNAWGVDPQTLTN